MDRRLRDRSVCFVFAFWFKNTTVVELTSAIWWLKLTYVMYRHSGSGIAWSVLRLGYGLECPRSIPCRARDHWFLETPRLPMGTTHLHVRWVVAFFPGVEWQGHETDHCQLCLHDMEMNSVTCACEGTVRIWQGTQCAAIRKTNW
jgi:hypothetical protein